MPETVTTDTLRDGTPVTPGELLPRPRSTLLMPENVKTNTLLDGTLVPPLPAERPPDTPSPDVYAPVHTRLDADPLDDPNADWTPPDDQDAGDRAIQRLWDRAGQYEREGAVLSERGAWLRARRCLAWLQTYCNRSQADLARVLGLGRNGESRISQYVTVAKAFPEAVRGRAFDAHRDALNIARAFPDVLKKPSLAPERAQHWLMKNETTVGALNAMRRHLRKEQDDAAHEESVKVQALSKTKKAGTTQADKVGTQKKSSTASRLAKRGESLAVDLRHEAPAAGRVVKAIIKEAVTARVVLVDALEEGLLALPGMATKDCEVVAAKAQALADGARTVVQERAARGE